MEQYRKLFDEEAPFSHISVQLPICRFFTTLGITVNAAFRKKYNAAGSVGDHRFQVFDFSSVSILGMETPTVTKTAGHNLQYKQVYTHVAYWLTARHRMYINANLLKQNKDKTTSAEFMLQYNSWDKELKDLMLAAEKKCRKIKTDHIAWSQIIGIYLR